jgi:hypothetical protein
MGDEKQHVIETLDERIERIHKERSESPVLRRQDENFAANRSAMDLMRSYSKLEWYEFDSELIRELMSLVDPEIFQEALDNIGE